MIPGRNNGWWKDNQPSWGQNLFPVPESDGKQQDSQQDFYFARDLNESPGLWAVPERSSSSVSDNSPFRRSPSNYQDQRGDCFVVNRGEEWAAQNLREPPLEGYGYDTSKLTISDAEMVGMGSSFSELQISQTNTKTTHTTQDPDPDYSKEMFERIFPFDEPRSFSHLERIPQSVESQDFYNSSDLSEPVSPAVNSPSLTAVSTESKKAHFEGAFDPKTGQQLRVPVAKRHRRSSSEERLNRRFIRRAGGQCPSCKTKKRKVSWPRPITMWAF